MGIGTYISIITLNVNGLNAPTKRHRHIENKQKMAYVKFTLLVIILNLKGLNTSIEMQRLAEWIRNENKK